MGRIEAVAVKIIKARVCIVAVFFLWPLGLQAQTAPGAGSETPYRATIISHTSRDTDFGESQQVYEARFIDGPQQGTTVTIGDNETVSSLGFTVYAVGDTVFVSLINHVDGSDRYLIQDHDRQSSLWLLLAIFIAAVIVLSRWRGLRSLAGLAFSFLVIIGWIVPLIAQGYSPVTVTLIGASAILIVSFIITEGLNRRTLASGIGTVLTMILTGLLSSWAIRFANLTGNNNEEAFFLQSVGQQNIDIQGLLLAGIIIGTLGILDDIAVSQVATVAELREANPRLNGLRLYTSALRVGRSHMAAIVNTLVLAYAGTSLPLLVLLNDNPQPTRFIVNSELVATEIVRSIIGSLGLIMAVPITTAIAVWLRVGPEKHHGHARPIAT